MILWGDKLTTKQYLGQLSTIERLIANKKREAERWHEIASSLCGEPDGDRVQRSSTSDKMAAAVATAVDCEKDAERLTLRLVNLRKKILREIDSMERAEERIVLNEYYVCNMSVSDIAAEWQKSPRHVIRVKKQAESEFYERTLKGKPRKSSKFFR